MHLISAFYINICSSFPYFVWLELVLRLLPDWLGFIEMVLSHKVVF
uniref:Uncharacterized protein n=1 Tax=Anguilla anguilla TaxID=7936 RepID=A0A0E9SY75_ANGAN